MRDPVEFAVQFVLPEGVGGVAEQAVEHAAETIPVMPGFTGLGQGHHGAELRGGLKGAGHRASLEKGWG